MVQIGVEVVNIIAQLFTSSTVKRVWFASQVLVQPLRKTNLKQGFVWHWIVQVCYSNKMLTMHSRNTQQNIFLVLCWLVQNITVAPVFPQQSEKVLIHWSSNVKKKIVLCWLVQNITVTSVFPQSRVKRFWSTGPVTAELFLVLRWHILGALLTVQIITIALVHPHSGAKRF